MFSERERGFGIVYVGDHAPGQTIAAAVMDGDSVQLRVGNERVLVRNVVTVDLDEYRGIICGFQPSFAVQHDELVIDQEITFSEKQIFGCVSAAWQDEVFD